MEDARPGILEIKVVSVPKRVRAARMKKCAAAMTLFGHDIGIRCGRFGGRRDVSRVNFVRAAGVEDLLAERIFADKPRAKKWKGCVRFCKVDQYVVRSTAGTLRLGADVAQLLGLGIDVDEFDLIDDPIAAREQAATAIGAQFFHIKGTAEGAFSEGEEVSVWQAIFVGLWG